jgi:DNA-binding winged helix-turn-helix (wHTH) protein/predicted ATPase
MLNIERIPLDLLFLLVERPGDLVTRAQILDRVWGSNVFVDAENAVNTAVRKLRRALNDDPKRPAFVATVPKKGYRFIGLIEVAEPELIERVTTLPAVDGRVPGTAHRRIVGRDNELTQLHEYFERASKGARQIVFVTGEPGIGKTTLVESFTSSLAPGSETRIGLGQCIEQYGSGEPYMPVFEALTRLCNQADGDRVIQVLSRIATSWLVQMPAFLSEAERERLERITQGMTQPRMLREMAEALEVLTRVKPLVLVFEDLHWSDRSTLELIATIGRRSETARLLVIGIYRPIEIQSNDHPLRRLKGELELQGRCEEMKLSLLSQQDVAGYLTTRLAGHLSSTMLASAIHRRTEGNPLFMVNVVDYLVEQRKIKSGAQIKVPPTIQQMIQRNLGRLDADDQRMLEAASVAGIEFSAATVAAALKRPLTEIETCCSRLVSRDQFITAIGSVNWPDGSVAAGFKLDHALYREVLYDSVSPNLRTQFHSRIARCLETAYGEDVSEIASDLAHHYRNANDGNKAVHYFAVAGEQAIKRSAHAEAVVSLTAAIRLLNGSPDSRERAQTEIALQMMLGGALMASKGYASEELKSAFGRAYDLCQIVGDAAPFPVLHGIWLYHYVRGESQVARRLAEEQCLKVAKSVGDPGLLLEAHLALGATLFHLGLLERAKSHLEEALSIFDSRVHGNHAFVFGQDPATVAQAYDALTLWHLGFLDRAREKMEDALRQANRVGHPLTSAFALAFAAWLHLDLAEAELARMKAEAAMSIATEYSFPLVSGMGMIFRGSALVGLGHPDEGIKQIQGGREICEVAGASLIRPYFLTLLAEGYRKANRIKEGRAAVAEALASMECTDERAYEADTLRLDAELLLAQGGDAESEAEGLLRSAMTLARVRNAKSLELRAASTLARLLSARDRRQEARALLGEVYNSFSEGFSTIALQTAGSLLDQL